MEGFQASAQVRTYSVADVKLRCASAMSALRRGTQGSSAYAASKEGVMVWEIPNAETVSPTASAGGGASAMKRFFGGNF